MVFKPLKLNNKPSSVSVGSDTDVANRAADEILKDLLVKKSHDDKRATDIALAKCWLKLVAYNYLFCTTNKKWYCFNGRYWQQDETNSLKKSILDLAKLIARKASTTEDFDLKQKLTSIASSLEKTRTWKGLIEAASVLNCQSLREFDQNIDLINLHNGTFDLASMSFREHRKDDRLTTCLPYEYNSSAKAQRWDQFLYEIFGGDVELIEFLQKGIGYSCSGKANENHFFFLHGTGANGKSVFISTIQELMSAYAVKIPLVALMFSKNTSDAAKEIVRLIGKRLVISNEVDEGGRLSESTIKDLTGGDTLTGRRLYEETVEFKPTHALWIYGNHKPVIKGSDAGIWRRPLLIPFLNTVPEDKRDLNLSAKLKSELPGIFNWAMDGLAKWKKQGLKPIPSSVSAATSEYKDDMDLVGSFLKDCTIVCEGQTCRQAELYRRFQLWQKDNGDQSTMLSNGLTRKLKERGLVSKSGAGNATDWINLSIIN